MRRGHGKEDLVWPAATGIPNEFTGTQDGRVICSPRLRGRWKDPLERSVTK